MIDLDFYCWREQAYDVEGKARLLVPHANPDVYEFPLDLMFSTEQEARDWIDDLVADETIDAEEANGFVLVHYRGEVVESEQRGACILTEADILAGRDEDCTMHDHEGEA